MVMIIICRPSSELKCSHFSLIHDKCENVFLQTALHKYIESQNDSTKWNNKTKTNKKKQT